MIDSQPMAVVLSPHLDDAVFSCPALIRERAKQNQHPLILTLFSHAHRDSNVEQQRAYAQRQRQDGLASRLLGATQRLAGFVDAPFRSTTYRTFSGIVCGMSDEDAHLECQVRKRVQKLLDELQPQRVLAPLGVGQHVDHRITHQIASKLAPRYPNTEFVYYEDRPYAFVNEAVRLRLSQLGRESNAPDFEQVPHAIRSERFFLSFFGAPYTRQQLKATDQARVVMHLLSTFVQSLQEPTTAAQHVTAQWEPDVIEHLLPALDAYATESRGFLGSPLYHQWAALEYSRRLGFNGQYIERIWRL